MKDDWDADSEEETPAAAEGVKESWDDSSEEEEEKPAGMLNYMLLIGGPSHY